MTTQTPEIPDGQVCPACECEGWHAGGCRLAPDPRFRILTRADYCSTPGHENRPIANIGGLCQQCDEDVNNVHPAYRKTVPGVLTVRPESAPVLHSDSGASAPKEG